MWLSLSCACGLLLAQQNWFPFSLPWNDGSKTVVDASGLLIDYPGQDPATVIDSSGFVRARSDGHFYFSETGKRVHDDFVGAKSQQRSSAVCSIRDQDVEAISKFTEERD
jgi:hypothetical protein